MGLPILALGKRDLRRLGLGNGNGERRPTESTDHLKLLLNPLMHKNATQ